MASVEELKEPVLLLSQNLQELTGKLRLTAVRFPLSQEVIDDADVGPFGNCCRSCTQTVNTTNDAIATVLKRF